MSQDWIVYVLIGLAVAYLAYRFWPKKKNRDKGCEKCD
jgi:hypothetical protein